MNEDFHTLRWYECALELTPAMEDYLEMLVRLDKGSGTRLGELASALNVGISAASRMAARLRSAGLASYEPYGLITLTERGTARGKALIERHEILNSFFSLINGSTGELELVEKIEHFFDDGTVKNLSELLKKLQDSEHH